MTDRDAFIAHILDSPDDAPRLVFADWLDEHGDPEHAAFIRIQCALAARPDEDEQWLEWKLREEELWAALLVRWQPAFTLAHRPARLDAFERGFLATPLSLHLTDPGHLDRDADRWTFALGLHAETYCHASAAFFTSETFWRVLELNCQRSGVTDESLAPLVDSPHFSRLRSLELFRNSFGPAGIAALAACPSLTALRSLSLDENRIGDAGVIALITAPLCRNLTSLSLFETAIGDDGILALASSPSLGSLRSLSLRNNWFGPASVRALAESACLPQLERLDLGDLGESAEFRPWCQLLRDRLGEGFRAEWFEEDE